MPSQPSFLDGGEIRDTGRLDGRSRHAPLLVSGDLGGDEVLKVLGRRRSSRSGALREMLLAGLVVRSPAVEGRVLGAERQVVGKAAIRCRHCMRYGMQGLPGSFRNGKWLRERHFDRTGGLREKVKVMGSLNMHHMAIVAASFTITNFHIAYSSVMTSLHLFGRGIHGHHSLLEFQSTPSVLTSL